MIKLLEIEKNRSWDIVLSAIKGCKYKCSYCYMHNMGANMKPRLDIKVLNEVRTFDKPLKIFLGGAGDGWGQFIKSEWIKKVLDFVEKEQFKHDFMFITKNPQRYEEFKLPRHAWFGTTDDGTKITKNNVECLRNSVSHNRFVSYEPLIEKPNIDLRGINWVIIGADLTEGASLPPKEWINNIIKEARKESIPIWINDSCKYPEEIKEFPQSFLSCNKKRFKVCQRTKEVTDYEDDIYIVKERFDCGLTHLSISRKDGECIHDWRELQKIKNELVGCEREAVEIYPRETRVLDARNSFHLWVFDVGVKIPFGFGEGLKVNMEGRYNQRPFDKDEVVIPIEEVFRRVAKGQKHG